MVVGQIPSSADELTPGWFDAALGLPGQIDGVALERLGGLTSVVFRARLTGRNLPASVIVKLPALRGVAVANRLTSAYEREVMFYRELAGQSQVEVPALLWSKIDPETGDAVLILEDPPGFAPGPEGPEASHAQARLVLSEVARLHSAWWQDPKLASMPFVRPLEFFIDMVEFQLRRCTATFLDRFSANLNVDETNLIAALPSRFRPAVEPLLVPPRTLIHQDLSLRNLLFSDAASPERVMFIDWQLIQHAPAVRDISYFIAASMTAAMRARHESGLLRTYHQALVDAGVRDYPLAQLKQDYRRSVICDYGRMVMTGGQPHITRGMHSIVAQQLAGRSGSAEELALAQLFQ